MTKRVLILGVLIAVIAAACGKSGVEQANSMPGRAIFEKYNCGLCHGMNGEGKPNAPALRDLKTNWQKTDLIEYLKHPAAYAQSNERLQSRGSEFPAMMPDYDYISDVDMGILADFLLALE